MTWQPALSERGGKMATATTPGSPAKWPRPKIVNLPNVLTFSRFILALVLFLFIGLRDVIPFVWLWCLAIFTVATVTDYFDGYYARKLGLTSTLGRNLDPLVDKVLICGTFTFLLPIDSVGIVPWMVVVVISRELIITSLRGFLESEGIKFGADWLGKLKMGLQCATLIAIFIALQWNEVAFFRIVSLALIYAMVGVTALSGAQYLWKATALLKAQ
jgi:CDP-diacylglycerol---glycerol-3-phosphate 3-phosphatidyltransferase